MAAELPAGYRARAATPEDAEAFAAMANANAVEHVGEAYTTADEVRSDLQAPGAPLAARSVIVVDAGGELAAGVILAAHPPFTEVFGLGEVERVHRGRGLGSYLVDQALDLALPLTADAPAGAPCVLRWGAWNGEEPLFDLLRARGFQAVRHVWLMRIELATPPPPPVWPDGIAVRTLRTGDERAVYDALVEAFRDHWGEAMETFEHFRHEKIESPGAQFDPGLWFLAMDGGEIAGVAICQPSWAGNPQAAYVWDLGVRSAFRRRGIAMALLRHAFAVFRARGARAVDLHVDSANPTGAVTLYEAAGMTAHPQHQIWERPLSAG